MYLCSLSYVEQQYLAVLTQLLSVCGIKLHNHDPIDIQELKFLN